MGRYAALLKQEREQVENAGRVLKVNETTVRDLLSGVDKRHTTSTVFTSKMMTARIELYRALGNSVAFMIGQFGNYKVAPNGQVIFVDQSTVDQYNATLKAIGVAATRVSDLEKEGQKLIQAQKEGWDKFVSGK